MPRKKKKISFNVWAWSRYYVVFLKHKTIESKNSFIINFIKRYKLTKEILKSRYKKLKLEFKYFTWSNFLAFTVTYITFSLVSSLGLMYLENQLRYLSIFFLNPSYFEIKILFIIITLICLIIILFIFKLIEALRIQRLHNQPSWILYLYFGMLLAPLYSYIFYLIFSSSNLIPNLSILLVNHNITTRFLIVLIGTYIYFVISPKKISNKELRFASDSVGINDDLLNFKSSAENVAEGIKNLKNHVSVVAIYAAMGSGKSSFARMIIESLPIKSYLYTYISLTETNEAKDFSKLFSERWTETLKSRYPKIDNFNNQAIMSSILRETNYSWVSDILSLVSQFNIGLLRTISKVKDQYYDSKTRFVSEEISKLFGNIPEITEDMWIVVIDEIERAKFEETYHVIEIIERFKNEGRSGLPTKIVFILCISRVDLEKLLKDFSDKEMVARLINDFLFVNPKNITNTVYVPPIPKDRREDFVSNSLTKLIREEKIDV